MDEVASAIADPVRREILVLLRSEALPAGAIAARFPISRPAVSRHLRVLREAGLVTDTAEGRERVYRLDVAPLAELDAWLAPFRDAQPATADQPAASGTWDSRFDALATEVHRTRRERRAVGTTTTGDGTGSRADAERHAGTDADGDHEERTA